MNQPYLQRDTQSSRQVSTNTEEEFGNTSITSFDVGMSGFPLGDGNWSTNVDDIPQAFFSASNGVTVQFDQLKGYQRKCIIENLEKQVMIRNNTNIGIRMKMYYVSPRVDSNDSAIEVRLINLLNGQSPVNTNIKLGMNQTLFDFPQITSKYKLKLFRTFILYPGETKLYRVVSPISKKYLNIPMVTKQRSNSKYHRALVIQAHGLPVHSSVTAEFGTGPVAYSPVQYDCIIHHKFKVRSIEDEADENVNFGTLTTIPAMATSLMKILPAVNDATVVVDS